MSSRRRSSSRKRRGGRARSSGKKRYPSTIKVNPRGISEDFYKKGETSKLDDRMTLETLRAIAWRNGIPFGGLNKTELLKKLRNSLS